MFLMLSHIFVRSFLWKFKSHKIMSESRKIMCFLQFRPLKNCNHPVVPNHCYSFLFIYICISVALIKTLSNAVSRRTFHGHMAPKQVFNASLGVLWKNSSQHAVIKKLQWFRSHYSV